MEQRLAGTTALVTGAGRGFGRAIAVALAAEGAPVVGVARSAAQLAEVSHLIGERFTPEPGDATDAALARTLVARHRPRVLVLNAGAGFRMAPLHHLTWDDFSTPWNTDTRHAFEWITTSVGTPLGSGSVVVLMSSGAALAGSPMSGGYAGAKATMRFLAAYAREESERAGLGLRFVTLFPQLTPATGFGARAVAAYAQRRGVSAEAAVAGMGAVLTPGQVAAAVVAAVLDPAAAPEQRVTAAGVEAVA